MPRIVLECRYQEVADVLLEHFPKIELVLQNASHQVLGFDPIEFVVIMPQPLLRTSANSAFLTIHAFASDRPQIHGKEVDWRNKLALAWYALMLEDDMAEVLGALPHRTVEVWPHIAAGARWGSIDSIIKDISEGNS